MRELLIAVCVAVLLAACDMPGTTNTEVNCEQQAGASVRCPDSNLVIPPVPE